MSRKRRFAHKNRKHIYTPEVRKARIRIQVAQSFHKSYHKARIEALNHYSHGTMACANLFGEHEKPYTNLDALSIDHINGGGKKHLKSMKGKFYFWLKKNNFPEGFQVLCMNCNWIKRRRNKEENQYSYTDVTLPK